MIVYTIFVPYLKIKLFYVTVPIKTFQRAENSSRRDMLYPRMECYYSPLLRQLMFQMQITQSTMARLNFAFRILNFRCVYIGLEIPQWTGWMMQYMSRIATTQKTLLVVNRTSVVCSQSCSINNVMTENATKNPTFLRVYFYQKCDQKHTKIHTCLCIIRLPSKINFQNQAQELLYN